MVSVTVAVPAWNEEDFIAATIESILSQTYPVNIVVVDDRSTDNTREIALSYADRGVQCISLSENAGSKSRALNKALEDIHTDIFVCVDADTIMAPDAIEHLIPQFSDPKVMICSGMVNTTERSNFWQGSRNADYVVGQTIFKRAQQTINSVVVMSGCMFAIRTDYLKEKKFSERTMAEDMDLTWVAIAEGYKVKFVPEAKCYVNDPHNWYLYSNQMTRWFRGYFQNLKVRKFKLPLKFSLVVYFYIISNILSVPLSLYAFYLLSVNPSGILFLIGWITFIWTYCAFHSRERIFGLFYDMIRSIAMCYVNWGLYMYSLYKELVARDSLQVWVKGH